MVTVTNLRGRVNNRLEKVLSVFDQTYKDKHNRQVLNIDEQTYAGDEEMNRILTRLLSATSDAKVRQDMNVEEEYFQAIENRDTAIMMRDAKIAEQDGLIAEKDGQIAEKDGQIAEQKKALSAAVKGLKTAGFSPDQIASMTNLTIDEINVL